jgi:hypothetical protein
MSAKMKHMEFIQSVVTRMNTNSFLIKGWSVTLVAAVTALAAKAPEVCPAFLLVPAFWILDGFYLSQERRFRGLYDEVRAKSEQDIDFSMDTRAYAKGRGSWVAAMLSRTLLVFYAILGAIAVVAWLIVR